MPFLPPNQQRQSTEGVCVFGKTVLVAPDNTFVLLLLTFVLYKLIDTYLLTLNSSF